MAGLNLQVGVEPFLYISHVYFSPAFIKTQTSSCLNHCCIIHLQFLWLLVKLTIKLFMLHVLSQFCCSQYPAVFIQLFIVL